MSHLAKTEMQCLRRIIADCQKRELSYAESNDWYHAKIDYRLAICLVKGGAASLAEDLDQRSFHPLQRCTLIVNKASIALKTGDRVEALQLAARAWEMLPAIAAGIPLEGSDTIERQTLIENVLLLWEIVYEEKEGFSGMLDFFRIQWALPGRTYWLTFSAMRIMYDTGETDLAREILRGDFPISIGHSRGELLAGLFRVVIQRDMLVDLWAILGAAGEMHSLKSLRMIAMLSAVEVGNLHLAFKLYDSDYPEPSESAHIFSQTLVEEQGPGNLKKIWDKFFKNGLRIWEELRFLQAYVYFGNEADCRFAHELAIRKSEGLDDYHNKDLQKEQAQSLFDIFVWCGDGKRAEKLISIYGDASWYKMRLLKPAARYRIDFLLDAFQTKIQTQSLPTLALHRLKVALYKNEMNTDAKVDKIWGELVEYLNDPEHRIRVVEVYNFVAKTWRSWEKLWAFYEISSKEKPSMNELVEYYLIQPSIEAGDLIALEDCLAKIENPELCHRIPGILQRCLEVRHPKLEYSHLSNLSGGVFW